MTQNSNPAYSILAAGYDVVMEHVSYDYWADFVQALLLQNEVKASSVLELGCGTGSFAFEMEMLLECPYHATDLSGTMIQVAKEKKKHNKSGVTFGVADFSDFKIKKPVSLGILLYDGLNYLLEADRLKQLFACAFDAIQPGGYFLFDQSTPANSINNAELFEDEGEAEGFVYARKSEYDKSNRIHNTNFTITYAGQTFTEHHQQKAWHQAEVKKAFELAGFELVVAYDGFSMDEAHSNSERVHWLVRRR